MRTRSNLMSAVIMAAFVLAGCAPTAVQAPVPKAPPIHTVVLAPDPDGHVGKAEVTNLSGKTLLEKPYEMTKVSNPSLPPLPPAPASPEYIAATFAAALAIEPLPSEKFILFFETGKLKLDEKSQNILPAILETIKRRNPVVISISGHADAAGATLVNDKIALQRAELVRKLLLEKGIDPQKIMVSSYGKGHPLVATPDGVAEARNRRVEVLVR